MAKIKVDGWPVDFEPGESKQSSKPEEKNSHEELSKKSREDFFDKVWKGKKDKSDDKMTPEEIRSGKDLRQRDFDDAWFGKAGLSKKDSSANSKLKEAEDLKDLSNKVKKIEKTFALKESSLTSFSESTLRQAVKFYQDWSAGKFGTTVLIEKFKELGIF